jgi:hypothetical protein
MKLSLTIIFMVGIIAVASGDPPKVDLTRTTEGSAESLTTRVLSPSMEGQVVVLAPVGVTAPKEKPFRSVEQPAPKTQPFTFESGGTMLEHKGSKFTTKIGLQYDPKHRTFSLLDISW